MLARGRGMGGGGCFESTATSSMRGRWSCGGGQHKFHAAFNFRYRLRIQCNYFSKSQMKNSDFSQIKQKKKTKKEVEESSRSLLCVPKQEQFPKCSLIILIFEDKFSQLLAIFRQPSTSGSRGHQRFHTQSKPTVTALTKY